MGAPGSDPFPWVAALTAVVIAAAIAVAATAAVLYALR